MVDTNTIITHGGYINSTGTEPIDQMCEYNAKAKTWSIRSLPTKKVDPNANDKGQREGHVSTVGHTLTATQNENDLRYGNAYLFGGGCHEQQKLTNQFYKYNLSKNLWEEIKHKQKSNPKPNPRAGHSSTFVGKDKTAFLCIIGGFVEDTQLKEHYGRYANDVWVYKFEEDLWCLVTETDTVIEMKQRRMTPRMGHSACCHDSDTIYCFGGSYNGLPYDEFYKLTIKENEDKTWSTDWKKLRSKGTPPTARTGHSACIEVDKWQNPHMYIVGGRRKRETDKSNGKAGMSATERSRDIYIYDINSNTWSEPVITNANIHTPSYLGTALPYDHSLLVFSYSSYNSISDDNIESDHIQLDMLKLEKLLDINPMDLNRDVQPEANGDIDLNDISLEYKTPKSRFVSSEVKKSEYAESKSWKANGRKEGDVDVEISQKNDEADNGVEQEEKFDSDNSSDTGTASAWTNDTGDEETDPEANDRENTDESGYEMQSDAGEHTTDGEDSEDFEDY